MSGRAVARQRTRTSRASSGTTHPPWARGQGAAPVSTCTSSQSGGRCRITPRASGRGAKSRVRVNPPSRIDTHKETGPSEVGARRTLRMMASEFRRCGPPSSRCAPAQGTPNSHLSEKTRMAGLSGVYALTSRTASLDVPLLSGHIPFGLSLSSVLKDSRRQLLNDTNRKDRNRRPAAATGVGWSGGRCRWSGQSWRRHAGAWGCGNQRGRTPAHEGLRRRGDTFDGPGRPRVPGEGGRERWSVVVRPSAPVGLRHRSAARRHRPVPVQAGARRRRSWPVRRLSLRD